METVKLSGYERYKPAGIEWLGEIPEHWQVKRIKDIAATTSGTTPTSNNRFYYENGEFNWIRTTDLNNGKLIETEYKVTPLAMQECRLSFLPVDSVLVAMYGGFGSIGKNAILKQASTINQSICAVLPNPRKFDSLYLQYFLHYFRDAWRLFADGARKDPNINQDAVKNLFVIQPPIKEQVQIARFLDRKTQLLDKQAKLLKRKILAFEALRKTLINETVCRGLDSNAPRKPSGVAWLGDIPAHWEIRRLKDVGKIVLGKMLNTTPTENYHLKPYLKSKNIAWLNPIVDNIEYMYFNASEMASYRVKKDDLLLSEGGEVGKTCIWNDELDECYIQNSVHKITISKRNNPRYFLYASFLMGATGYYNSIVNQVSIKHLTWEKLNNVPLAVPPLAEQNIIAAHLDQKTQKIDSIVTNLKAQTETLKELRRTLINEVVTGKLKVTE